MIRIEYLVSHYTCVPIMHDKFAIKNRESVLELFYYLKIVFQLIAIVISFKNE